ncbi:MAG: PLP-dependent aminotransferase family protein [Cyanobacteria bacterium HKST-UBA02]|nr:PLP-dependent aminotransferase family protein [Cyanobacteria bacterium HKST-UBA02]
MNTTTDHSLGLMISLDPQNPDPLFRQMAMHFKRSIESLRLRPGQLLPSSRELAEKLRVSRATAVRCYEELSCQGYIETIDGVGTFVSRKDCSPPSRQASASVKRMHLSSWAEDLLDRAQDKLFSHDWPELNYGCAPAELLPVRQWRQLLLLHTREFKIASLDYNQDPFGYMPLRRALAEYLGRSRSTRCSPEQVIVFPSSLFSLHLVSQMLIDRDDLVIMDEPGCPYARHTFLQAGATPVCIPVDRSGMVVSDIEKTARELGARVPRIIYVNPSHQQPTGAPLSIERRQELLRYAADRSTIIIEDDVDSDFCHASSSLPSLQGLSDCSNVIYIGNFWQTLYPVVNVGYLVIPDILIDKFTRAWHLLYHTFQTHLPALEQLALTDLLDGGFLERHNRKSGRLYLSRWQAMVSAFTRHLRGIATLAPEPSGMHMLVRFDQSNADQVIRKSALSANLPMLASTSFYMSRRPSGEFLVPFAFLDEQEIANKVSLFTAILQNQPG